jgi:hypothetical protein
LDGRLYESYPTTAFKNGWLVAHKSSKQEITNLLGIVARDLKDSQAKDVSDDWRFAIAYNAALQAATAALAASGYRAGRDSHHYRVIQSLELTAGKGLHQRSDDGLADRCISFAIWQPKSNRTAA